LVRAALILTLLQFGASAATFVQQLFIARVVGATTETDGYQVSLAMVVFVAQGVIATALVNAFVPRLATLRREDLDSSRDLAFWAQITVVVVASVVTAVVWIASPAVVSLAAAGLSPMAHASAVESLRIMMLAIPFAAVSGVYTASLYASGDLTYVAVAQIVQNAFAAAFSVIAYGIIGFTAFPLSLVVGTIAGSVALFARLHQRSLVPSRLSTTPPISAGVISAIAGPFAVPVLGAVPGFVERWFTSFFPIGQIAILAYAGRIFSVVMTFGVSVGVVALTRWSEHVADDRDVRSAETSRNAATAVVFAVTPATVVLLLMPDVLVQAFFGSSAMSSSQLSLMSFVLSVYSLSLLPMALITVILRGFYGVGDPNGALNTTAIWVLLWVALDVALVPSYGIVGLAVASVAAVWLALVLGFAKGRRHAWLSVWPAVIMSRETLAIVISSVISVTVAWALIRHVGMPLGLAVLPVVAAYLAMCAAGGSRIAREVVHRAGGRFHFGGCR
jgi:putative peptidoglycan lipid II flippase